MFPEKVFLHECFTMVRHIVSLHHNNLNLLSNLSRETEATNELLPLPPISVYQYMNLDV